MSTIALSKLLDYILSLPLSSNNKEWLASKIIESESTAYNNNNNEEKLYSMFGAWSDDADMDVMEKAINEGRISGKTRNIVSFD